MVFRENELGLEDYQQLRESVGWNRLHAGQAARALKAGLFSVTAWEDGRLAGMARLVGDGLYLMAADVVVRPEYQHRGIGRRLVERLLEFAEDQTPSGGRTSVQLIAEPGREGFYESLGFRRLPHEASGSGMRRVIHRA
ncbi:MAG: GNAT family N-acetyltransferase [Provencibacterium sp.]|jgi:GNAT superfamily N-acetyltransferase|nr:GNAT family N-acetyltransferase [Provencibacterium sp.]